MILPSLLANERPAPSGGGDRGRVSATEADEAGGGTRAPRCCQSHPPQAQISADSLLTVGEGEMP